MQVEAGPVRLAAAGGLVLLAAACGGAPASPVAQAGSAPTPTSSSSTTSTTSTRLDQALAFSRCMRSNGVANFPDPDSHGDFPSFRPGVPKPTVSVAQNTCEHLLSSGETASPQQRRQKLAFGVKVAECLRSHGYPNMPDPTGLGRNSLPSGIDPNSAQFQATENSCEQQARKALGLP